MRRGLTGYYVPVSGAGETCRAFVPFPLPPAPTLQISEELREDIDKANLALGRLDGLSTLLPDPKLFLFMYVRKEAVLSSQIEGTQSSLSDLLLFENHGLFQAPLDDVQEVSNYVAAMNHGLKRLADGFPLSLRLLKEIHQVLLARGRGAEKEPGEFRRSQNWIGGTRPGNATFVPPPPDYLIECLGALEKFLHNQPARTTLLIKAALAHVQFETIHPFLDGNGRLGRLLITLLFCAEGVLREPLLYLSLYFKEHRDEYYQLLQSVRMTGDWEAWIHFFVAGVRQTAEQAALTARQALDVFQEDRLRIESVRQGASSALRLHQYLQKSPLTPAGKAAAHLKVSTPTVNKALQTLVRLGIVRETTGGKYGRIYAYERYLALLEMGGSATPAQ